MNITEISKKKRPIKVAQFGGGAFLRGFFDWMLAKANESGVYNGSAVIVRAKTRGTDPLSMQDYMYTHVSMDGENTEKMLVDCIEKSIDPSSSASDFIALALEKELSVVVSNTTEAGIYYEECEYKEDEIPDAYPARLAYLLYRRYKASLSPLLIIPCELLENTGDVLKSMVIKHAENWKAEDGFFSYIERCSFRNTLVDRIVSGAPSEKIDLEYEDALVNTSEYFHLFVISGKEDERLPFRKCGINIIWTDDISAYRTIKVRILNGAHTSMIPYALTMGVETVYECMNNGEIREFIESALENEIIPSLDFDKDEATAYARDVIKRFENPHIRHLCASIALNSVSKFKVRVLPSIKAYREKFGNNPKKLVFALSRLIMLYRSAPPKDDDAVILAMNKSAAEILANKALWGEDISYLLSDVEAYL